MKNTFQQLLAQTNATMNPPQTSKMVCTTDYLKINTWCIEKLDLKVICNKKNRKNGELTTEVCILTLCSGLLIVSLAFWIEATDFCALAKYFELKEQYLKL